MIKSPLLLIILSLILVQTIRSDSRPIVQKNEIVVKYIEDYFSKPTTRSTYSRSNLPYTVTASGEDRKGIRYTEWGEGGIGNLAAVSNCKDARVVSGELGKDSVFTALCTETEIGIFTVGNGVDQNEKVIKSVDTRKVPIGQKAETYTRTDQGALSSFLTAGYSKDQKSINLNTFSADGVLKSSVFTPTQPQFTRPIGIAGVQVIPPTPTPPGPTPEPTNGLSQQPAGPRFFSIVFEKSGDNLEVDTGTIAITNYAEETVETKFLALDTNNNFLVNNPRIINVEGFKDQLFVTYTNNKKEFFKLAKCKLIIDSEPTGNFLKIEEQSCKDLEGVKIEPETPVFATNRVQSGNDFTINKIALYGGAKEKIELVLCDYNLSTHVASNCIENETPINPVPQDWVTESLKFAPNGALSLAFSLKTQPEIPRAFLFDIFPRDQAGFEYETLYDGRVTSFVYLHERAALGLRVKSYSLYNVDFDRGVVIADTRLLPEENFVTQIVGKGGSQARIELEIIPDLVSTVEFDSAKVPNFSVYDGETVLLPLGRSNFVGNGLDFKFKSADKENDEFSALNVLKVDFELEKFQDRLLTLKLADDRRGYILISGQGGLVDSYYVECSDKISETGTKLVCKADESTKFEHDKTAQLFDVYPVLDPSTPGVVAVVQTDSAAGSYFFSYSERAAAGKRQQKFRVEKEATLAKGFFFHQLPNGSARLLVAYPSKFRIDYYLAQNLNFDKVDSSAVQSWDKTSPGLENDAPFCPKYVNVCSHSNSFFEVGSICTGDARIYKWNLDLKTGAVEPRGSVSLNGLDFIGVKDDIEFCPSGDEFTAYGSGKLYGTKTKGTQASFNLGLDQFGIETLDGYTCLRRLSSYSATGVDKDGKKRYVATFFGNTGENAKSRIHSVFEINPSATVTSSQGNNIVNHFIQEKGKDSYIQRVYLAGPIVHFTGKLGDSTDVMIDIKNAKESKEAVYQGASVEEFEDKLKIVSRTKAEIKKGFNRFDATAEVVGHVWNADIDVKKEELKDKITFVPRVEEVTDGPTKKNQVKFEKMRRLLQNNTKKIGVENDTEEKLLGLILVGSNLMTAITENGRTKVILHRGFTSAEQGDFDLARICTYFAATKLDKGSLAVLGCNDGNTSEVISVFFPDDDVADPIASKEVKTTLLDGLILEKQKDNTALIGVWTKYYNSVYFHQAVASKAQSNAWTVKITPNIYPNATQGNFFIIFS